MIFKHYPPVSERCLILLSSVSVETDVHELYRYKKAGNFHEIVPKHGAFTSKNTKESESEKPASLEENRYRKMLYIGLFRVWGLSV